MKNAVLGELELFVAGGPKDSSNFVAAGDFNRLEMKRASAAEAAGRGYVIKLSYANGKTPLAEREFHEDNIDDMALTRDTGWRREARIYVSAAAGIEEPDAVGVLYFPSPSARKEFREEETDVVEEIGQFNRRHLDSYVYLYGYKD